MKGIFLLLGTNIGKKTENLRLAVDLLQNGELHIVDYSSIYESAPWGKTDQNWFLNMVLRIDTVLTPLELLEYCLETEKKMGRIRAEKWGERIIDIDVLYYDNVISNEARLVLPHPGIPTRKFTLMPLTEVAPNEIHPALNLSQKELLKSCNDDLACYKTEIEIIL